MFVVENIINNDDRAAPSRVRLLDHRFAVKRAARANPPAFCFAFRSFGAFRVVKRLTGKVKPWFLLPVAVEENTQ